MQEAVIKRAKELLADGTVNRVVGWKAGEFAYDTTPAVSHRLRSWTQASFTTISVRLTFQSTW